MWPDAVMVKCKRKWNTPLHTACKNDAPLEVILFLLHKWPGAVNERNIDGKTPLHTVHIDKEGTDHVQTDVQMVLSYVSQICDCGDGEINDDQLPSSAEMIDFFERIQWLNGILLLLDRRPAALKNLHSFDIKNIPSLLSFLGRHYKIAIMSDILSNKQDIFADI
eukprot:12219409-Ditylum_brightwellii.AAC.1